MIDYIFYSKDYCHICLENKTKNYICKDCIERFEFIDGIKILDEGICLYPLFYNNFIKKYIKKFKYEDCTYLVKPFTEILYKFLIKKDLNIDYISFVPMYFKDEYKRGYNQLKILGKYLSYMLEIPMIEILKKNKSTKHQNKLDRKERLNNLKQSFETVKDLDINSKTILIVDDVVTTGSTFNAISKEIKINYDCEIIFLALASSDISEIK